MPGKQHENGKRIDTSLGDGAPQAVVQDDTGRLSQRLMQSVGEVGIASTAEIAGVIDTGKSEDAGDPDLFLDALAAKLYEKQQSNGNGGGPPPKKFMGLDGGAWTKLLIGYLIAAAVGIFLWWLAVRDGLQERPTRNEVQAVVKTTMVDALGVHSITSHPPTERRLRTLEKGQRTIRDSQIRQEGIDRQQTVTLKEIRDDVKRLRRRR